MQIQKFNIYIYIQKQHVYTTDQLKYFYQIIQADFMGIHKEIEQPLGEYK